jgi:DNA-directed RNA polymerase specialized sigma subunit
MPMVMGEAEILVQNYLKNALYIPKEIKILRQIIAEGNNKQQYISKSVLRDHTRSLTYQKYVADLEHQISKMQAEQDHIVFLVSQVKSEKYQTVLELLYFDGMTAEKAAEKMGYCLTHFSRLKVKALSIMVTIIENDESTKYILEQGKNDN